MENEQTQTVEQTTTETGGGMQDIFSQLQTVVPDNFSTKDIDANQFASIEIEQPQTQTQAPTQQGQVSATTTQPPTGGGLAAKADKQAAANSLDAAKKGAAAIVSFFDMVVPRVAGAYSGAEIDRYRLTDADVKDYKKAWAEYLATQNINVSPAFMLILCTLAIFGGIFAKAFKDKKDVASGKLKAATDRANGRTEGMTNDFDIDPVFSEQPPQPQAPQQLAQPQQQPQPQAIQPQPQTVQPQQSRIPQPPVIKQERQAPLNEILAAGRAANKASEAMAKTYQFRIRKKFDVDANGFYIFNIDGLRVPALERAERPTSEIVWMLENGYKNRQIIAELKK